MLQICRLDHLCVCLESVLWQNGSLDPDAIWVMTGVGLGMGVLPCGNC